MRLGALEANALRLCVRTWPSRRRTQRGVANGRGLLAFIKNVNGDSSAEISLEIQTNARARVSVFLLVEPERNPNAPLRQARMRTTDANGACVDSEMFWRVCPELAGVSLRFHVILRVEFNEGGGLKNRRLHQCKISIGEVVILVRLRVRGEVAERPNAAVC